MLTTENTRPNTGLVGCLLFIERQPEQRKEEKEVSRAETWRGDDRVGSYYNEKPRN